jgi:DNA-binding protein Fis
MSSKLKQIRRLIEDQVGFSLDLNTRKREVVLARTVYYMVARDFRNGRNQVSLSAIGEELSKDHTTVLHAINNNSFQIMDDEYYSELYDAVMAQVQDNKVDRGFTITSPEESKRTTELYLENVRLRKKLKDLVTYSDRFAQLTADLNEGQLDDVYDKVTLMVKVMNA